MSLYHWERRNKITVDRLCSRRNNGTSNGVEMIGHEEFQKHPIGIQPNSSFSYYSSTTVKILHSLLSLVRSTAQADLYHNYLYCIIYICITIIRPRAILTFFNIRFILQYTWRSNSN